MNTPASMLEPAKVMRSIIQRIATGPELSKDISREEALAGMRAILDGRIDPIQTGIFFIALRMKRETDDEVLGVLDAVRETTATAVAPVDEVVDIADPYDGYNRCLPAAPFVAPLLAELGVAAISHGLDQVGPKFGVTHRHILAAAGVPVDLPPEQAAARLGNATLGWSYVDQARFNSKLHDLVHARRQMVKRQVITTVEVAAKPVVGRKKTHFVTGFVHKPYPPIYAMMARAAGFDSALIIRGVEGGVIPSLRQSGKFFRYWEGGELDEHTVDPASIGIQQALRSVPLPGTAGAGEDEIAVALDMPATAKAAAEAGMAALAGRKGPSYDSLLLSASLVLYHLGRVASLAEAAEAVRAALDSGRAAGRVR
jgi:anthranilate phosphoribosyltransferase